MTSTNYTLLSIEGNIGGGKSTLLQNLKEYYKDIYTVLFIDEPVSTWEQINVLFKIVNKCLDNLFYKLIHLFYIIL